METNKNTDNDNVPWVGGTSSDEADMPLADLDENYTGSVIGNKDGDLNLRATPKNSEGVL